MKVGSIPESFIEWVFDKLGIIPRPMIDTLQAALLARSIMAGTKLGVFEAVAAEPLLAGEIAGRIGTDARATEKLLGALVVAGYLRHDRGRYGITAVTRKWLLKSSPISLHDNMLHRYLEWMAMDYFEEYVRTGKPLAVHDDLPAEHWGIYQRGMRSLAALSVNEVARRMPIPPYCPGNGARTMLDVGGSHGLFSVAICRRHPDLTATVLDLPEAIEHAAPLLAAEQIGGRVVHRAGNALTEDLGKEAWDLILVSQLVHHFDEKTNRELVRRLADALRPGGVLAIMEVPRPPSPGAEGQTGGLLDLLFAVTSESGAWSLEELTDWQREAGLVPQKPIRLRSGPATRIQAAAKVG